MRKALEGLPWVDQDSATANVAREQVVFQVKKGMHLDEAQLLEAFRNVGFPKATVIRKTE